MAAEEDIWTIHDVNECFITFLYFAQLYSRILGLRFFITFFWKMSADCDWTTAVLSVGLISGYTVTWSNPRLSKYAHHRYSRTPKETFDHPNKSALIKIKSLMSVLER